MEVGQRGTPVSIVSWGRRERFRFTLGGKLGDWQPTGGPAIYAITYKPDENARPKSHTVVYFGETPDLSKHSATIRQEVQTWWDEYGGTNGELFIFFHEMPGSSQYERARVQHQLVSEYDPCGNN